ncbi:hypothetical protein Kirov_231 [Bacillus phage Kirov]|uniref:Uncharacterized protein n=1 Tax=Bacillus phage Kirov TaxID=2783539 RepID=A0A7U3RX53_9CAUD|nr:hypothetical protein PQE67_gp073 [Bacillus phage Kirov]QOV08430.1 hypothetical protein Kirov_231 [Bacillus phage Kirov]
MYTITFENQTHNQWTCQYIFEKHSDAVTYLRTNGFSPSQGLFVRKNFNWSVFTKAYIIPREVWK